MYPYRLGVPVGPLTVRRVLNNVHTNISNSSSSSSNNDSNSDSDSNAYIPADWAYQRARSQSVSIISIFEFSI